MGVTRITTWLGVDAHPCRCYSFFWVDASPDTHARTSPRGQMIKGILITAAGTILAGLVLIPTGFYRDAASWLWGGALWVVATLVSSQQIPSWAIIVLGLLGLSGIVIIGMAAIVILRRKNWRPVQHPFANYTEDLVDGVRWRWTWDGGRINNLWCFCPTCDAQLVTESDYFETRFICERCLADGQIGMSRKRGRVVIRVDSSQPNLVNAAGREIMRRVRMKVRELPHG